MPNVVPSDRSPSSERVSSASRKKPSPSKNKLVTRRNLGKAIDYGVTSVFPEMGRSFPLTHAAYRVGYDTTTRIGNLGNSNNISSRVVHSIPVTDDAIPVLLSVPNENFNDNIVGLDQDGRTPRFYDRRNDVTYTRTPVLIINPNGENIPRAYSSVRFIRLSGGKKKRRTHKKK